MPNGLDIVPGATLPPDAELVARIVRGDTQAEALLAQRYYRVVLALLLKRLPLQPEQARDLSQETFYIAVSRLRRRGINDPERLAGFLRKIAVNLYIAEQRKAARRRTEADSALIAEALDDAAGPLPRLEREQATEVVRMLIAEMPVLRDRELIWRYYVLGHDKPTLCRDFKLSAEHFDRVLHRARSRLKELVEKYNESAP